MSHTDETRDKAEGLLFMRILRSIGGDRPVVTDEEVAYYREHPDEIDVATSPGQIHRQFLWLGSLTGLAAFVLAKVVAWSSAEEVLGEFVDNLVVDLLFEVGVAMIGASVTAYLLGVLLVESQKQARQWRQELRKRVGLADDD
ncbi:MAG: hypothetical protein AAF211_33200 [Myxococcota bacterium]